MLALGCQSFTIISTPIKSQLNAGIYQCLFVLYSALLKGQKALLIAQLAHFITIKATLCSLSLFQTKKALRQMV
ncbi:hypothetical protein PPEP_a1625 [Pseudoalteromonas peptidolytica F12-50-A1]|uniref:Uncharacterized protein n=1 Tax=Pseudoalteromonas peptidolytica F12-50-A1 TaxID=1315280 RepID=A0A8I0MXL3_9GAMM|nr:hypothetical protein [Pseudoalteromonas peptidolytica F12-50-A1]